MSHSAHTKGKAADLAISDSQRRFRLVQALLAHGARRVGVGATTVHVDLDDTLPLDVLWLYGSRGERY